MVQVQNQRGPHSNKWDLSGTVIEALAFEAYLVRMDGSGRITKRNRQYLKQIFPYKSALQHSSAQGNNSTQGKSPTALQLPQYNMSKSNNTGSTADQAGRPCTTEAGTPAAAAKSPVKQLPSTDTQNTELWDMTDDTFYEGLAQAAYNVLTDEITDIQPEADSVSPSIQPPNVDSGLKRPKRVKFSTERIIEQM